MQDALSRALLRIEWQLFVTLPFGANWSAKKTRNKVERVFAWLRRIQLHHNGTRSLEDMPFVCAEELGEVGERYHVHLVIGGLPRKPTKTDCFAMEWLWREEFRGGHAKIRPYTPTLRGVGYVLKTLSLSDLRSISSEGNREKAEALAGVHVGMASTYAGANAFEVGKMGKADEQGLLVMVSPRCQALMVGSATARGRRRARSLAFFRRDRTHTTANTAAKTGEAGSRRRK